MELHPQRQALLEGLGRLALPLPDGAEDRLLAYLDLLARWSRVYNLTAVRDPGDMLTHHLLDCLAVVAPLRRWIGRPGAMSQMAPRVLDVGSGAGLPGVVLAIAQPDWSVTCVDTVAKKASFIRQAAVELGLANLAARHQRVEDMVEQDFDVVTSRAFSSLADLVALTRGRLGPQGIWVAMKAKLTADEREAVGPGVEVFHVEPLSVPGLDADRCLVWMKPRAIASRAGD